MQSAPASAIPVPRRSVNVGRVLCLGSVALIYLGLVIWATPLPQALLIRWAPMAILSVSGVAGWASLVVRPKPYLAVPALAASLLIAAASVSAVASAYPSLGASAVWHMCTVSGTGLLIWRLASRQQARRDLIALVTIFIVVLAGADIAQVLALWRDWLAAGMSLVELPLRPGFVGGLVGISTWLADYLVVGTPLAVVALFRGGAGGRAVAAALAAFAVAAILVSGTRSLWILVLIMLVFLVIAAVRRRAFQRRAVILAAPAVAMVVIAAAQLNVLARIFQDADEGRLSLFATALRIGTEHPLLGAGGGTYGVARVADQVTASGQYPFINAQNLVLTTFAETGLLGLGAMVVAVTLLLTQLRVVYAASRSERPLMLAALAGLVLLLGHSMVDVVVDVPGILLMAFAVAAFVLVPSSDRQQISPVATSARLGTLGSLRLARYTAMLVVAILVVCAPLVARVEGSIFLQAEATSGGPDADRALSDARTATDLTPDFSPAWAALAVASDAAGRPEEAAMAARRSFQLDGLAQHEVEEAVALDSAGLQADALSTVRDAAARDPGDPFVQLNAGMLLARHGAGQEAEAAFQRLLQVEPTFGLAAAGLTDQGRASFAAARRDLLTQLIDAGAYDAALRIALTSGDPPGVDATVRGADAADNGLYAQIASAWMTGSPDAIRAVEGSAANARGTPVLAWWAWLLAAHRCDAAATDRWGKVYSIRTRDLPSVPVLLGRVPETLASMEPPLYPTALWQVGGFAHPYVRGTWVYMRGTPSCGGPSASRLTAHAG